MMDYSILELVLCETVGLSRRPVAVAFRSSPPPGIPKFAGKVPSSCSFFGIAAGGMTFYTVAVDHYNCALGCYCYNLPLPSEHAEELTRSMERLRETGSLDYDDVRAVPRTEINPEVVVYSPLGDTPVEPDVAVLVVRPLQAMFLQEAAMRKRIEITIAPFGQPTCISMHQAMERKAVTSAGCMGNRVYNALGDDEMYMMMPGLLLKKITDEVQLIATTNTKLAEQYLQQRNSMNAAME
jgi:uncharacterized protein (DUF169 family)